MRWRHIPIPALILVLLALLLAAPLTAGDKGLWLSLHGAHESLLGRALGSTPIEHSTLLPDRSGRVIAAARIDRPDPARSLGAVAVAWAGGAAEQWGHAARSLMPPPRLRVTERPDPRAPPA